MEEYIDKVMEHKHALIFVGGIAAARRKIRCKFNYYRNYDGFV